MTCTLQKCFYKISLVASKIYELNRTVANMMVYIHQHVSKLSLGLNKDMYPVKMCNKSLRWYSDMEKSTTNKIWMMQLTI